MLPMTISNMIQAQVSFTRVQEFLLNETIDQSMITHQKNLGESITCENCNFGWSRDEVFLKNLNLKINTGSLTASKMIVLNALKGDANKLVHKFRTLIFHKVKKKIKKSSLTTKYLLSIMIKVRKSVILITEKVSSALAKKNEARIRSLK